jgi:hypothetical protein
VLVALYVVLYYAQQHSLLEGFAPSIMPATSCPDLLIQEGSRILLYNSRRANIPGVNPISFDNLEDYAEFMDWQRSQNIHCPVLYLQQSFNAQGESVFVHRPNIMDPEGGLQPTPSAYSATPFPVPTAHANPTILSDAPMHLSPLQQQAIAQQQRNNDRNELLPSADSPIGIASQQQPPHPQDMPHTATSSLLQPEHTLLVDATHADMPYNQNSYPANDPSSFYVGTHTPLDDIRVQPQQNGISPNPMDPNWGGSKYTQSLVDAGVYQDNNVKIDIE